jgi:hypothetical protein
MVIMDLFKQDQFPLDYDEKQWRLDMLVAIARAEGLIDKWEPDGDEEESELPNLEREAA